MRFYQLTNFGLPRLWIKTRKWEEVKPSLINMVKAVKIIREKN